MMKWQLKEPEISTWAGESHYKRFQNIFQHFSYAEKKTICTFKFRMLEPLVYGDYPYVMRKTVGSRLPNFSEEESELVKGSSDFIGIIHYLAASVTNTKPNPTGYSDFYSDTGITLSCLNQTLKSFFIL